MFMDGIWTVHRGDDCSTMSGTSGGKTQKLEVIQWCWRLESFGDSSHIWHLGWAVKKMRFFTNPSIRTSLCTPPTYLGFSQNGRLRVVRLLTCQLRTPNTERPSSKEGRGHIFFYDQPLVSPLVFMVSFENNHKPTQSQGEAPAYLIYHW